MKLSKRQRDIINPFVTSEYEYSSERGKWIQSGIHDSYINFGTFPKVGDPISPVPYQGAADEITDDDLRAYVATYPQNARFSNGTLGYISDKAGKAALRGIASSLNNQGLVRFYTSPTSAESYLPENQKNIDGTSDNNNDILDGIISQLIAIPLTLSLTRLKNIRESFGHPTTSILEVAKEPINDDSIVPFRQEVDSIDLYNWHNNALPGNTSQVYYYNPNDERYYFVKRTNNTSGDYFDIENGDEQVRDSAIRAATEDVLKAVGKLSPATIQTLVPRGVFKSYLDIRPASRWIYAVTFPRDAVDSIPKGTASSSKKDEDYTPLEKARLLINQDSEIKNTTSRHATYTLEDLQRALKKTTDLLKDYSDAMDVETITPDMLSGFDIERDSLKLETAFDTMSLLFQYNSIEIEDTSKTGIEFAFRDDMRINYIIVDGYLYTDGLGATFLTKPITQQRGSAPETSSPIVDVFSNMSNRALGFIYSAITIESKVADHPKKKRINWDEFLLTYARPRVKISPSLSDRKKKLKSLKVPEPATIFQRAGEIFKPTGADLSRLSITGKDTAILVNNAMGSCDSAQSSALKSLTKIYRLFTGKYPLKALIREAALLAKEELVESEVNQKRLEMGVGYFDNPSRIYKEVEQHVNNEVTCIIDLLGDEIGKQVLDPIGVPPSVRDLVKSELPSPVTLKFGRMPNFQNVWALWKKALKKLLVAFIKQMIMGILQDVLKAALGCGPKDNTNLDNSRNLTLFNLVSLNDFLEGIDIVEIGNDIGLLNKEISITEEEIKIITSPPTLEQLQQFNLDVSTITTPVELGKLLDGDASEVLINTINEMVNSGEIAIDELKEVTGGQVVRIGGQGPLGRDIVVGGDLELRTNKIIVSKFQESLGPNDERYAVLGIDDTAIVNYFKEIGLQMSPETRSILDRSPAIFPEDAYCDDRTATPPNLLWGLDISTEQQTQQQQDAIDIQRLKLISLCETLKGNLNFQLELEGFLDGLPNSEIYDLILQWIADLSNQLAESYSDDLIPDNSQSLPPAQAFSQTEFGRTLAATSGKSGVMQYAAPEFRDVRPGQIVFRTSRGIEGSGHILHHEPYATDARRMGYLDSLTEGDLPGKIGYIYTGGGIGRNESLIRPPQVEGALTRYGNPVSPPSEQAGDGHIMLWITNSEFRLYWRNDKRSRFYGNNNPDQRRLLSSGPLARRNASGDHPYSLRFSPEDRDLVENRIGRDRGLDNWLKSGDPPTISVSNTSELIYYQVKAFYFDDMGRTRLPGFTKAIVKPLYASNSDDCIKDRDEYIAKSIVGAIHARLIQFFMNVGPLMRVYPPMNTPDTNEALTSYLVNKIKKEIMDRGLFGPITQNMDKIKTVFGQLGDPSPEFYDALSPNFSDEKLIYTEDLNDSEMVDEVIKQSYFLILRRLRTDSVWDTAVANFFEGWYETVFHRAADSLLGAMQSSGTPDQQRLLLSPLAPGRQIRTPEAIEELEDKWRTKLVLYQLPGPLLLAMQYVLFDYVVKPMERYPKFKFESESRIAFADDQVLASINPTYLSMMKFSAKFKLFPITVGGETFYYLEDLEKRAREEYRECMRANRAVEAANTRLQEAIDYDETVMAPLLQEYETIDEELSVFRGQAQTTLNQGYAIVAELLREDGPAEAGWSDYLASPNLIRTFANLVSSAFEDGDAANTNGNITFIQAWWNWAKRTYTGDVWTKEYFLSGNRGLGHGNFLGANYNNIGMRNWLAQARDASARFENDAVQAKIGELHDVIVRTDAIHSQAYQIHWRLSDLITREIAAAPGNIADARNALAHVQTETSEECQESSTFTTATDSVRSSLNLPPIDWSHRWQ